MICDLGLAPLCLRRSGSSWPQTVQTPASLSTSSSCVACLNVDVGELGTSGLLGSASAGVGDGGSCCCCWFEVIVAVSAVDVTGHRLISFYHRNNFRNFPVIFIRIERHNTCVYCLNNHITHTISICMHGYDEMSSYTLYKQWQCIIQLLLPILC